MQSGKPHENVRIRVVELIAGLLKRILEKRYEVYRDMNTLFLLELLKQPEGLTLLMPQEVYVDGKRYAVDALLGDVAVIEYKGSEREFDEAVEAALSRYWSVVSKYKYYIVTTWDKWRIYQVEKDKLQLVFEGEVDKAREFLETQVLTKISKFKIPPTVENIETLFKFKHEEILKKLREAFNLVKNDTRVKPLYEAYKSIMKLLYSGKEEKGESFYEDLFIRHTYMHMVALASLTIALGKSGSLEDVCSGSLVGVDVALPYLNWWRIALYNEKARKLLIGEESKENQGVLNEVVSRANLVDWEHGTTEDIFRTLYEFLVDDETRRKLGEYYTPTWLVEFMLRELGVEGVVLDPFCGSGTFLVEAFHKKIEMGKTPDEAYSEIVGFDVNPLAVAVARAQLILAYNGVAGKEPEKPPHIYHVDTLAMWFKAERYSTPGLVKSELERTIVKSPKSELEKTIENITNTIKKPLNVLRKFNQINMGEITEILRLLTLLEEHLTHSIRFAYHECGFDIHCLENRITSYLERSLSSMESRFVQEFLNYFKKDNLGRELANLIVQHGGDAVWATVLISILAPILLADFSPDIIVTNPPWIHITKYKSKYKDNIRKFLSDEIKKYVPKKTKDVVNGSDVAVAALAKAIEISRKGVGFVMNRNQLFNSRLSAQAGIIASYCMLKKLLENGNAEIKLYDVDFNAFGHNVQPALGIIKKGARSEGVELYVIKKLSGIEYSKSTKLSNIESILEIKKYSKSYEEYVKQGLTYFTEDPIKLAKGLGVEKVYREGLSIPLIKGGELKKKKKDAGLILADYSESGPWFKFRLYNTSDYFIVPKEYLEAYGIDIYQILYMGEIYPFYLTNLLNVLLSKRGIKYLIEFLETTLELHKGKISIDTYNKVQGLISKLAQIKQFSIVTLDPNKFYTIYRRDRVFTALTYKPNSNNVIASLWVSYIETNDENKAYYYAAVLNYLAYIIKKNGLEFDKHQYAKPLAVIDLVGLAWNEVDDSTRNRVVELSKLLHRTLPRVKYQRKDIALLKVAANPQFQELVKILDSIVDKDRLEEALKLVAGGEGGEEEE